MNSQQQGNLPVKCRACPACTHSFAYGSRAYIYRSEKGREWHQFASSLAGIEWIWQANAVCLAGRQCSYLLPIWA